MAFEFEFESIKKENAPNFTLVIIDHHDMNGGKHSKPVKLLIFFSSIKRIYKEWNKRGKNVKNWKN